MSTDPLLSPINSPDRWVGFFRIPKNLRLFYVLRINCQLFSVFLPTSGLGVRAPWTRLGDHLGSPCPEFLVLALCWRILSDLPTSLAPMLSPPGFLHQPPYTPSAFWTYLIISAAVGGLSATLGIGCLTCSSPSPRLFCGRLGRRPFSYPPFYFIIIIPDKKVKRYF
jgi:hypothetical protein